MASIQQISLTNAGGTFNVSHSPLTQIVYISSASSIVLAADVVIQTTGIPSGGESVIFQWTWGSRNIDLNGFTFTINGQTYTQQQLDTPAYVYVTSIDGAGVGSQYYVPDFISGECLSGARLFDATVTLAKLEDLTAARIIVGNASNRPTAVAVTGDVTISNAGVTAIGAGVIVNADVNASAAIDRSKLGNGTADHVVINSGAGAFSSEAQLANSRGGTGQDTSASTGFATVAAGTWSVGALTDVVRVEISFAASAQGTYYVAMPACTVTKVKARVTSTIAGTDDGTIQCQDASSTNMTAGLITIPASSAHGTGVSVTPSANNTFTAGQEMQLVVSKTTAGGTCSVDITFTRTALT